MSLRGCSSLHFIWSIKDGAVEKVYNMNLHGKPSPKFKKLEDIYQLADAEKTTVFAERETNGYDVEENEPDCLEELTLSQFKKKLKRKKRKVSEPVLLTPKVEDDDFDLTEPLCKFRVKVSKSSRSKRVSANGKLSRSSEVSKEFATFNIKVEEVEYFENNQDSKREKLESIADDERGKCDFNEVFEVEYFENNQDLKRLESEPFTNEMENCDFNEVSEVENFEVNRDLKRVENCEFNQVPEMEFFESNHDLKSFMNEGEKCEVLFESVDDIKNMENKNLTSMNIDAVSKYSISDDISVSQKLLSVVFANTDSELMDRDDQTGKVSEVSEIQQLERLPLTRKFISPNSQEKLCQAMKSADSLDDMEHFKRKEKLNFEDTTFSSTKSDTELNAQFIQNKAVKSTKHALKKQKNYKNSSCNKNGIAPKGCLDGPRLRLSLPRISTGCTSIEGCSESAIAFSQRQMHDIESLASKLMNELNSMKVIVEEKLLYEAYRSTTLKNEADEVKSAIKSATKTEETAKKWLSMMARDCNRFCKIMKLNEDNNASASVDPSLVNKNQDKTLEREKKKICFADEAGGTLCDVKVYQIEQEPYLA